MFGTTAAIRAFVMFLGVAVISLAATTSVGKDDSFSAATRDSSAAESRGALVADVGDIIKRVQAREEGFKSGRGIVTLLRITSEKMAELARKQIADAQGKLLADPLDEPRLSQQRISFKGKKWRYDSHKVLPKVVGPTADTHVLSIYDGSKGYRFDFGTALVIVEATTRGECEEVQAMLGLIDSLGGPRSHALASSRAQVIGEESVNASKAIKLQAAETRNRAIAWWVVPDRGYACVKQEITDSFDNVPKNPEYVSRQLVYQVDRFLEVNPGMWLPAEGTMKVWNIKQDGSKEWMMTRWLKVSEFQLNVELPDSIFVVNEDEFPVGFQVADQISKRYWVVGGDTTALQQAVSSGKFPPGVKEPKQP